MYLLKKEKTVKSSNCGNIALERDRASLESDVVYKWMVIVR